MGAKDRHTLTDRQTERHTDTRRQHRPYSTLASRHGKNCKQDDNNSAIDSQYQRYSIMATYYH